MRTLLTLSEAGSFHNYLYQMGKHRHGRRFPGARPGLESALQQARQRQVQVTGRGMTQNPTTETNSSAPTNERMRLAISRIAETDCPVLLVGERGVGKRSAAEQIHASALHRRGTFKEIPCGEVDVETLLGVLATNCTVYLPELSSLSLPLQECLVRRYFRSRHFCNGRLLFGSCREPVDDVRSLRLNEDFCYLVSAVTLRIPPLRCRKPEIPALADELLAQYARQFSRPKPVLRKEVMDYLVEHAWPGNFPEFQTAIKTFVAIEDQAISFAALRAASPNLRLTANHVPLSLKDATRAVSTQIERQLISEVLAANGGNRKRTADELRISYKALLYKIRQFESASQSTNAKLGVVS
jgi:two-component system, NtrC family, response regulator AtoC